MDAWNDLVSSDRARLLPRASLVREAKRLFESGSIDRDAARSAARKSMTTAWRRRIESALVDVMEASRDLERVRDPIVQHADDLEAASRQAALDSRPRARHGARRATRARLPHAGLRRQRRHARAVEIDGDHERDVATSANGTERRARSRERRRLRNPVRATRSSSCWPRLCQQVNAWRLAEKKSDPRSRGAGTRRACLRRISEEAEGGPDRALDSGSATVWPRFTRRCTRARTSMR